ncbi:YugN family protein [Paucisalibacillus globulus]|uniref:YugN family protein n=1 Tax=Paucisalibacillus globulus TaxID=351095 RepID=UPI00041A612A|nr:YugN family protein [Paucisalibacillus globulus]
MLHLETDMEGKQMTFGEAQKKLKEFGFHIGGNWDYDSGLFDSIMHRENGETYYIRMPFQVLDGELDRKDAWIEFQKPFVIKHVVNIGLDKDETSLLSATGFTQFQEPLDKDGYIRDKSKWQEFGEEAIGDLLNKL